MFDSLNTVKIVSGCSAENISADILSSQEPLILKGLVSNWPIVKAGLKSDIDAMKYILQFYKGESVLAFLGEAKEGGRIFYDETLTEFNYKTANAKLDFALDQLAITDDEVDSPSIYIGSTLIDSSLPGFRTSNDLALSEYHPRVSIWISNRCRVAAHWDGPKNIACSVVGKRRFTLFPPDQLENLYVGPLDKTPAGQSVSLVDFYNPDFHRYPKFKEALKHAQVAELEPGDALFLPSMWWHHVESLGAFNVLVNYWLRETPAFFAGGLDALAHTMLAIKDLPEDQRNAWKNLFNYYVFDYDKKNFEHIPKPALGALGEISEDTARRIRAQLLSRLNR